MVGLGVGGAGVGTDRGAGAGQYLLGICVGRSWNGPGGHDCAWYQWPAGLRLVRQPIIGGVDYLASFLSATIQRDTYCVTRY